METRELRYGLPEAFSHRDRDKTFAYNAIPNLYIADSTLE